MIHRARQGREALLPVQQCRGNAWTNVSLACHSRNARFVLNSFPWSYWLTSSWRVFRTFRRKSQI